jgi:RNA polymerase sigma-70 factor (ECF subfamily)
MTTPDLVAELAAGRQRFLALVGELRPELHRYCARMTGSIADGEDIVQDTLARAYYALSELDEVPPLRPWLFRIAHNRAIDFRRRYDQRMQRPLDAMEASLRDPAPDPEDALAHNRAVAAAISQFTELPPAQRSCVILKDVLDQSLDDIAALLELTVPAVKAALHRGRARLRELRAGPDTPDAPDASAPPSPDAVRYAQLFNARDWAAVRALLAEDVRLDLVSRVQHTGRRDVGRYFTNYAKHDDWHLTPAWLDGREIIAVSRGPGQPPYYFVELVWSAGAITEIHDFRYVPYIAREAAITLAPGDTS